MRGPIEGPHQSAKTQWNYSVRHQGTNSWRTVNYWIRFSSLRGVTMSISSNIEIVTGVVLMGYGKSSRK